MGPKIYFASVTLPKFEPLYTTCKFGVGVEGFEPPKPNGARFQS